LTTSDGEVIANPRFLAASAETIARLQRRKEHARRGSGNHKRLRRDLAKQWRKVRNRRRDFHHKTARALVDTYDVIALEKLNTAGMTRRPVAKPDPDQPGAFLPNMAAAKAKLSKAILDAGWAQFATILTAKAESAGRRVVFVNPAGTSIACHICGRECTRPRQDTVICPRTARSTPTLTGHATSQPGPGWALVKPLRLEKPVPLGIGAVTATSRVPAGPIASAMFAHRTLVREAHSRCR
jgi:transposase